MEKVSKTLSKHINSITELAKRLENHDGALPQIEVDMLLSVLREMYDEVYHLPGERRTENGERDTPRPSATPLREGRETENRAMPEPIVETAEPEKTILMIDTEAKPVYAEEPEPDQPTAVDNGQPSIDEIEGQPNDDLFEEEPEPEPIPEPEPEPEPVHEPEPEPVVEPKPEPVVEPKVEVKEEPKEEAKQTPQASLFDYIKNGNAEKSAPRTIADSLGNGVKEGIEQKINSNKISDLRTIININDKFSFMNELFHNNMKGYNDFILRLNAISNREEALAYVRTIAEQYSWDDESLAVKTFYTIFDRKF